MTKRKRGVTIVKGERHYRGYDGREILPDGRRPIRFVIHDAIKRLDHKLADMIHRGA